VVTELRKSSVYDTICSLGTNPGYTDTGALSKLLKQLWCR